MKKNKKLVIGVYTHPEYYPPTLNAIKSLSKIYDEIYLICSNVLISDWDYPDNVKLITVGNYVTIREFEKKSLLKKAFHFINYLRVLKKYIINGDMFIAYDAIPLLCYNIVGGSKKLWYHNHDVSQPGLNRKFTIGWFAEKNEPKMFSKIDIFSLPSDERKQFFPMNNLKGKYFFLPNYPSKIFYASFEKKNTTLLNKVRIIYQGSIGKGHGIEEIIGLLNEVIHQKSLELVLKGFISEEYKNELIKLAEKNNCQSKLIFEGVTSYKMVPQLACTCNLGIAIHTSQDRMNTTLGTASNKIYEYAACGLPILYFDNKHYTTYLSNFSWAFPVLLNDMSIYNAITNIIFGYETLSKQAKLDFESSLNYEIYFENIKSFLN